MSRNSIKAIPLTSIAAASIGGYAALNPNGLPNACLYLRIVNNTDVDVTVSYDGTTDNDFVRKGSDFIVAGQNNGQPQNFVAQFPIGMKVYIKGSAGSTGSVYLAGYYNPTT